MFFSYLLPEDLTNNWFCSAGNKDEQIENGPKVDGGSNTGLIVGLLVGVAVGLALLGFGGFLFNKRRLLQEQSPPTPAEMEPMNTS